MYPHWKVVSINQIPLVNVCCEVMQRVWTKSNELSELSEGVEHQIQILCIQGETAEQRICLICCKCHGELIVFQEMSFSFRENVTSLHSREMPLVVAQHLNSFMCLYSNMWCGFKQLNICFSWINVRERSRSVGCRVSLLSLDEHVEEESQKWSLFPRL